jgi:hypothetical protein
MSPRHLLRTLALAAPVFACAGVAAQTQTPASFEPTARAALQGYFAMWSGDARTAAAAPISRDVVLQYDHGQPEMHGQLQGRTSMLLQTRTIAGLGREWTFRDVRLFPTLRPNVYFAQYTAKGTAVADGAAIERDVVLRLDLNAGRLVRLVEYGNPATDLVAGRQHLAEAVTN